MNKPLSPGTLCILIHTPSGADVGRIVEIVSFVGRTKLGPELMREAYLTRCAAGRPLHSVRQWLPDGSSRVLRNTVYRALADRWQLRPVSGLDDAEGTAAHERGSTEVTA